MSGGGVPSSNTVPGAEQNSFYNSDPRNHLQANDLGKHGAVMHDNRSQINANRAAQNPHGLDNPSVKTAANASQYVPGVRPPNQPPNYYNQGASNALPNGPPMRGASSQLNGPNTSTVSQPMSSTASSTASSPSQQTSIARQQGATRNSPGANQHQPQPTQPQPNVPPVSTGPRPPMQQMHSGSAFTPVTGSREGQQNMQAVPAASGSTAQSPQTLSTAPATLPVSPPTHSSGSQRSTPSPKPLSALHSGKPKRPGLPVGPGNTFPGQPGVPRGSTPPSSGPPTPSGMPSPSTQEPAPVTSFPGPSQDNPVSRPSITSKRRQYPTQQPPSLSGPAGQGYPGHIPSQMTGQMHGQVPGPMPGQMPGQIQPGTQMPGMPGPMPDQRTMQAPRQMPGQSMGQQMPNGNRSPGQQMPGYSGLEGPMNKLTVQQPTGVQPVNLLEQRNIVPTTPVEHATPPLSSVKDGDVQCALGLMTYQMNSVMTPQQRLMVTLLEDLKSSLRQWSLLLLLSTCYDLHSQQCFFFCLMFRLMPLKLVFSSFPGYLHSVCKLLKENLDKLPGDSRTLIGFITFDSKINFYSLRPKSTQPQMLIVSDLDDIFLPAPDDLLVNLKENMELVHQLLDVLPTMFSGTHNVHSATGAAMQAALKLVGPTGGRVSVFQTTLPNIGPGELKRREEPNQKSSPKDVVNLAPATDFYKKFALDCAAEQCVHSKYSGGSILYYPDFHVVRNPTALEKFENEFSRYLTRKIGFEAVMRVRCTRGLTIHTFHGNFFVRSTDLVSLPNINPDTGFTMQIDIEDSLNDSNVVCFQSALLYTSSKGERRIRVHTLAMPTTTKLSDVYAYADQQAIGVLLAKMVNFQAVDRTLSSSLGDAREALMNACVDSMTVYRQHIANQPQSSQLLVPYSLRLLPLYVLALMKNVAFRLGSTARLDERCFAMQQLKTMPIYLNMLTIYPSLYPLHDISDENGLHTKNGVVPQPPCYNLSAEKLSRKGVFLMDAGHVSNLVYRPPMSGRRLHKVFYIWVGKETPSEIIQLMFNVPSFNNLAENMGALPELENPLNERVRCFIDYLQSQRTCHAVLHVFREDSRNRTLFLNNLMDDRAESVMSYYEFLVHLQRQVNK
ncbi:hypothetical protein QZH41_013042 [Actinostola sp. cb2023]|nr:hypothetical protein QZH41_013042 [Actinostola sp. cb2023]